MAVVTLAFADAAGVQDKPNILVICIWGDYISVSNISAYHRGMMGGSTTNIDRSGGGGSGEALSIVQWLVAGIFALAGAVAVALTLRYGTRRKF